MFVYSVKKRQVKMALLVFFVALLAVALIIVSHHTCLLYTSDAADEL